VVLSGLGVVARIRVSLSYRYRLLRHRTRILSLVVKKVPAGATVKATCSRHCSRRSMIRRNARPVVSLRALIRRPLRPGTVITVVVSRPGEIAAVKRLTIRARRKPRLVTRCLPPNAVRPQVCR
jgi:hypothetical protein